MWVFKDVPVATAPIAEARTTGKITYFVIEVDGIDYRTNVRVHSSGDPRTFLPYPRNPELVGGFGPDDLDAMIQALWPHDGQGNQQPIVKASLVNIAVDLFKHPIVVQGIPEDSSVGFDFNRPVTIYRSLNNGYREPIKTTNRAIMASNGRITWPRWIFNDVDVSAAQDPLNKYYFAVTVGGIPTHTTIWSHGADARTVTPQTDVPTSGCAG